MRKYSPYGLCKDEIKECTEISLPGLLACGKWHALLSLANVIYVELKTENFDTLTVLRWFFFFWN